MSWQDDIDLGRRGYVGAVEQLTADLDRLLEDSNDPRTVFTAFSRMLLQEFEIQKGFLALREGDQTRFLAIAAWRNGKTRKNLSLRLPTVSSLFEKVAESGQIYSENFADLFDGNFIERQLLIDENTASFMLRPLKHEALVVALLGYSSDVPEAFLAFEEGLLDPVFDRLGAFLGRLQADQVEV